MQQAAALFKTSYKYVMVIQNSTFKIKIGLAKPFLFALLHADIIDMCVDGLEG